MAAGIGRSEASLIVKEGVEVILTLDSAEGFLVHGFELWCRGMDRTSTRPAFPLPTQEPAGLSWFCLLFASAVFYGFQPERGTAQASGSPTCDQELLL